MKRPISVLNRATDSKSHSKISNLMISGAYTSLFLDTDEPKMALRARNSSGAFEKRAQADAKKSSVTDKA